MKDSGVEWIGEIPRTWRIVPVKAVFKSEKTIVGSLEKDFQRLALTLDGVIPREKIDSNGLQPANFETYQIVRKKDLIFKLIDLENIRTSRVGLSEYEGIVSPVYIRLVNERASEYGFWYFYDLWNQNVFNVLGSGVRSNLTSKDLLNLPFIENNNSMEIVRKIKKEVKVINNIVSKTKQSIEELKKYKQSLITEVVTKGLDKNVEMKDSGIEWIGEIPKDWEIVKLKKIISNKLQYGANESGIPYNPECPRYIRITDIMDSKTLKDENKISLEVEKSRNYLLEEGDFLFARSGASVGKFYLVDQKNTGSAFAGYLIRAKFNVEKVLPKYFEYYAHSWIYDEWKQSISIQSTIENIGAEKYNNLFVILPDIVTQKLLIKYLDKHIEVIDNLITNKIKIINEYESYKKSLIYEYVTGKKEVGEEVE